MKLSLIVQNVPAAFTAGEIWERVAHRRWGVVENIELLPVKYANYRDVLIHMYDWFSEYDYKTLMSGIFIMLYYERDLYWRTYIHNTHQPHGYGASDRHSSTYCSRQMDYYREYQPRQQQPPRPKTYSDVDPSVFLRTRSGHRDEMRGLYRNETDNFGRERRAPRNCDARDRRCATPKKAENPDALDEVCFEMSRMTIHHADEEHQHADDSTIDTQEQETNMEKNGERDLDEAEEQPVRIDYGFLIEMPKRYRRPVSSKKGK